MGTPLGLLAIAGTVLAILQRKDGDKILLAFVIPYLLFIGLHKLKFVRHLLLIYPALILFAAGFIDGVIITLSQRNWARQNSILKQQATLISSVMVIGGVGVYSLIYTAAFVSVTRSSPTTIEAAAWIESNIPPDRAIEYEPEILFDWLLPELDREDSREESEWVILSMPNAEVFLSYATKPTHYSAIDWYPLESVDTETAMTSMSELSTVKPIYPHTTFPTSTAFCRYTNFGPWCAISDASVVASRDKSLPVGW